MNNNDNIYHYPQRVTITLDLLYGIGANTIAIHALLNMLERLEAKGIYPSAATLHVTAIPTT